MITHQQRFFAIGVAAVVSLFSCSGGNARAECEEEIALYTGIGEQWTYATIDDGVATVTILTDD